MNERFTAKIHESSRDCSELDPRRVNKLWSVRTSRHLYILAEKHLFVSVRKEQSSVQPNNDKQGKLVAIIKEGKKNARTRPDAYTQKWCVRFACALVAYL